MKPSGAIQTCRFGVRRHCDDGSTTHFDVLDRMTGIAISSTMRRVEAEEDARRQNHDTSGRPTVTVRLGPAEVAALHAYFSGAGHHHSGVPGDLYKLVYAHPNDRG